MKRLFLLVLLCAALPPAMAQDVAPPHDWTSWGYDSARSGWNRGETTLNPGNVGGLHLLWRAQVSTRPDDVVLSTVTAPLVAEGVTTPGGRRNLVFLLGADDTLFALDADSGKPVWQKHFANPIKAQQPADWLCPNTANATPVIDKVRGVIYVLPSDGRLRGLALADGAERLAPVEMVAPFSRAWSLNLIGGVVYTTSGRACGEVLDANSSMMAAAVSVRHRPGLVTDPSAVTAIDVRDPIHPERIRFYTSGARPAAPWGRGGLAEGPGGTLILETSDGAYDPAAGDYSESILRLAGMATRLADSFTPANHGFIQTHDLAGSASPTVFTFGNRTLVAAGQKEGVLRLLDATNLGGRDHQTPLYQSPQLGNDLASGTDPSQGIWGAISTYATPDGRRFVYVPLWGPPSKSAPAFRQANGAIGDGSLMAFEVREEGGKVVAAPAWTSDDLVMPDPAVAANGVVYVLSTGGQALQNMTVVGGPRIDHVVGAKFRSTPIGRLTLYAYDAVSGKRLYSSGEAMEGWTHFSEPVVALGKVFVASHDARLYAFGLK